MGVTGIALTIATIPLRLADAALFSSFLPAPMVRGQLFLARFMCGNSVSMDSIGNLYGVVLHVFKDGTDGNPNGIAGIAVDPAGNVFGTAAAGGNDTTACQNRDGCGVIFEITK